MAGSVNKVILLGNLGRDPEVRMSQDGGKIVTFSIATTESWKDRATGERRDRTEWHRVVIFNEALGGIAEQYLRKGSRVYIEGQLQTRKWVDQQGIEKYTTEVVLSKFRGELTLLGGGGESSSMPQENWSQEPAVAVASGGGSSAGMSQSASRSTSDFPTPGPDEIDDDVPF